MKANNEIEKLLEGTEAGKIWSEIKEKNINMFSLPNQTVSQYCQPKVVEPSKLYLIISVSAALPALEAAIGNKYSVELVNKYIVVSRTIND